MVDLLVNSLEKMYAGALRQFTTGRMGWLCLCIFIGPLIEGAEGFIFRLIHTYSLHGAESFLSS